MMATSSSSSSRRGMIRRWTSFGLAAAASVLALNPTSSRVQAAEEAVPKSGMGIDLTPMSLNDALKEAERLKLSKQEKHILFEAGTEYPGTGRTANGYK